MEKRFNYLFGMAKHSSQNPLIYNELKELKKDILSFPMLRVGAMEKRIEEFEQENELLKAKLEINGLI